MFELSRLRWPIIVIGGAVFAALLAFAAFSLSDVAGEKADAAAQDETEEPITIQQHAWEDYHWLRTGNNPVSLNLGDNVSGAWDEYLKTASNDWSNVPSTSTQWADVLQTTVVRGSASSRDLKSKKCPAVSGQVEVCNAAYGYNGWLGIAQIWLDTDHHITAGTAKLNDSYYSMAKYNTPWWRSHVMCQEVGHTFGLGHQDESGADLHTCMDYANNPDTAGENNMHPNDHDYEQLYLIYNHTDSTSTSSTMPAAAQRGLYNSRSEWGRLKHQTADGHNEVYEREFSDGKLVTFVEKAEPEDQPQQKNQEKQQDQ